MNKCDWCNKEVKELQLYTDVAGSNYSICNECKEKAEKGICVKCGKETDKSLMMQGLCMNCIQVKMKDIRLKKEEERLGVSSDRLDEVSSGSDLSDEDYNKWMTLGQGNYNPEKLRNSKELQRLWIMVKLQASGLNDDINSGKYYKYMEKMLNRSLDKLINTPCRIVISDVGSKNLGDVIDSEDNLFIIKA